jgi:o-succinylbenzoate synthase
MNASRQFRIYDEKFAFPLRTAHGVWEGRRSMILREEKEDGLVSFGEAAPTPGFADCSLDDLLPAGRAWVRGESLSNSPIFHSALSCLASEIWRTDDAFEEKPVLCAGLDASGENVPSLTRKRKIGLGSTQEEIDEVLGWIAGLPDRSKVRLDANGSLSIESLRLWIDALEGEAKLEFVEQPLSDAQFEDLKLISRETSVPFALDETIVFAGGPEALRQRGWEGYYVIKPSLFPDWEEIIRFIKSEPEKSIVSTVFESPFGYEAVCRCASHSIAVAGLDRSLFKGNPKEFAEHQSNPLIPNAVGILQLDQLWVSL